MSDCSAASNPRPRIDWQTGLVLAIGWAVALLVTWA
jgi:hypothetical protein